MTDDALLILCSCQLDLLPTFRYDYFGHLFQISHFSEAGFAYRYSRFRLQCDHQLNFSSVVLNLFVVSLNTFVYLKCCFS